ncbi:MAG: DUF1080 domain-containing protein [Phycisphaerae bacterium]|nr:DUF1080 domain-containing protein [Phycisphaerae bacterium]
MRSTLIASSAALVLASVSALAFTQAQQQFKYEVHDMKRPQPSVVDPGPAGAPALPPSDAVVLFGASKPDLSAWKGSNGDAKWKVLDGAMIVQPQSGDITTKESFGDVQLHIEWMVPADAKVEGQHGGNSGVFFMDRYELQVLSSNPNVTYADGMAGSLYGQYPPLVNACRPLGQWNVYDVVFRAPVFGKPVAGNDGAEAAATVLHPASLTVFLNGVLVQDNAELLGATVHGARAQYKAHDATGPIHLQDHGDPIRYRNIWLRKLASRGSAE